MSKTKRNPLHICPRCGKGKPEQQAVTLDLSKNAAIVHYRCPDCGMPVVQYRNMTSKERQQEAQRILAEEEARRAEAAARAEREAQAAAQWEAEKAEIILRQRRGAVR